MAPEHQLDPEGLGDHVDRLYRAAWALCGSREEAEDLVQDTFARVLARPRIVRGDDDLGYLLRVLRNTFISTRRTAGRRPMAAGIAPEELELPDPARAHAARAWRRARARSSDHRRAARGLPRRDHGRDRRRGLSLRRGGARRCAYARSR